ncbi:M15 family metallopeptidase [Candidatus Sumerlaeota bacterium]|nr:M15 family metallopeptidase [Candidatus Sumerlaeota bacterium]
MVRHTRFLLALPILWSTTAFATDWIVLPEKVQPYTRPSLSAPRNNRVLRYGETIREEAAEGAFVSGLSDLPDLPDEETGWIRFGDRTRSLFLPEALLVRSAESDDSATSLAIGEEIVNREHPLPLDYVPPDLVELDARWSYHAERKHRLRPEAARMASRMLLDAEKNDGVRLRIVSSYRSARQQRYLYLGKIEEGGLGQRTVAKPGHSEHQLGTALDLSGLDPATVATPAFAETREGRWLRDNARRYGFVLSYTRESAAKTGYDPEPWHVRYLGKDGARRTEDDGLPDPDSGRRDDVLEELR